MYVASGREGKCVKTGKQAKHEANGGRRAPSAVVLQTAPHTLVAAALSAACARPHRGPVAVQMIGQASAPAALCELRVQCLSRAAAAVRAGAEPCLAVGRLSANNCSCGAGTEACLAVGRLSAGDCICGSPLPCGRHDLDALHAACTAGSTGSACARRRYQPGCAGAGAGFCQRRPAPHREAPEVV